jgi:hypothetical protein
MFASRLGFSQAVPVNDWACRDTKAKYRTPHVAALVWRLPKSLSWSSLPCTALWGWHNYLLPAFTGDRFALLLPPSLILSPFPLILVFLHAHQKTNRIFTLSCLLSREPKLSTVQLENLLKYKSTLLSGVNWTRIWGKNFRIFWFFFLSGVRTQGFAFAKQSLYCLNPWTTPPIHFALVILKMVSHKPRLSLNHDSLHLSLPSS